jgi:CelD/BcsL family acetyltransferase involved in cellulose biosynthesis
VAEFASKADLISKKTYKHAIGVGFVNDGEMQEKLRAAARGGALRACMLYVGDRPIAFAGGILSKQTFYGAFTGFDPAFQKYGPGLQSIIRLIEESFEPGYHCLRYDAGCGDSPYKRALFTSGWKEAPVWIFAPCAVGLRLHFLKAISTLLHYSTMRLLEKSDRLRKVKKMYHRQALRQFQLSSSEGISR